MKEQELIDRAAREGGYESPAPQADPPERCFGLLPCPRCGEETTISVDLDDLAQFRCTGCDGEWHRAELEAIIARWTPVLRWLDLAPPKEGA